jgi:hypothetical protein
MLFFIQHGTRRVYPAGITAHPNGEWVTRQARNLLMTLEDHAAGMRFVIRDRDAKLTELLRVFRTGNLRWRWLRRAREILSRKIGGKFCAASGLESRGCSAG